LIASAVIKNAKKLLSSTELSSAEIAEKLNFSTPSFFCRYFKRYTGTTPQEWRVRSVGF
jgi:YesN/AraC family two-component response regulator